MSLDDPQNGELLELEGIVKGSADEKGRIKIPSVFKEYLQSSGETVFFITTFNKKTIRMYTRDQWRRNAAILDKAVSKEARNVLIVAKHYGSAATIDKQGRVLMSPELRRALGIGNEAVYFEKVKDHVEIYGTKVYEQQLSDAESNLDADNEAAEALGVR